MKFSHAQLNFVAKLIDRGRHSTTLDAITQHSNHYDSKMLEIYSSERLMTNYSIGVICITYTVGNKNAEVYM